MLKMIGGRLLLLLPVLLLVSLGTFLLVELVPGDPALQVLGPNSTSADYERVRQEMGLDEPILERYTSWVADAVLHQDLGQSLVPPVEPVSDRLLRALPVNLELAFLALVIALVVSVPIGVVSAWRQGGRFDRLTTTGLFGVVSVPSFLAGILLILLLAVQWEIFPLSQWARPSEEGLAANLHHAFLPAVTLALTEIAVFSRMLRNDMIATLQEDFILAARAKGLPVGRVLFRHALRPSSFSLLTLIGVSLGRLIGGTVIVEALFSLPGVGRVIVEGALSSDYTMVQGGVLVVAIAYVLVNLVVDLLLVALDPRQRHR